MTPPQYTTPTVLYGSAETAGASGQISVLTLLVAVIVGFGAYLVFSRLTR